MPLRRYLQPKEGLSDPRGPLSSSTAIVQANQEVSECSKDKGKYKDITILPLKKHGRPLLLGEALDTKVQVYLQRFREAGGSVTDRIAVAAVRGLPSKYDKLGGLVNHGFMLFCSL